MRNHYLRHVVVLSTLALLTGCYSNGRWTMPNFAFWKSSDAKTDDKSAEASVALADDPVKPSMLAGTPGSPAPGAGLVSKSGSVSGGTSTPASYNAASSVNQYPYPSTQTPATAGGYGVPPAGGYVQPQTGQYSLTPPSASTTPSPYTGAYLPPAPVTPSSTSSATHMASNPPEYHNPIRNAAPATTPSTAVPPRTDPFDGRTAPPLDRGSYTPPLPAGGYTPPTAGYPPPAATGYPLPAAGGYTPPSGYVPPATDTRYPDPATSSAARPAAIDSRGLPVTPASYSSTNPPAPTTGYTPGATDYRPGNNGYTPAAAPPYQAPAGAYTSPVSTPAPTEGEFRPGGTSDYTPRTAPAPTTEARPSYTAVDGYVRPASYYR